MTDRINDLLVVLLIVGACLVGVIAGTRLSEGEVEDAYEQGCSDMIEAYYRNKPYYKAILDSKMYEDTILMGWVVRQFKDRDLPDPEVSLEDDTIAIHAWDSLGYCVLCGAYRYMRTHPDAESTDVWYGYPLDSTDATWIEGKYMPAIDSIDTMPAIEPLHLDSLAPASNPTYLIEGRDTMPAVEPESMRGHDSTVGNISGRDSSAILELQRLLPRIRPDTMPPVEQDWPAMTVEELLELKERDRLPIILPDTGSER